MLKKSWKNVLVGAMLLTALAMLLNGCGSDKQGHEGGGSCSDCGEGACL